MNIPISDEDAILQVLGDGAAGDFCDVAELVKKKFGFTVGSALVEKVYQDWQQENGVSPTGREPERPAVKIGHVDLNLSSHMAGASTSKTGTQVSAPDSDVRNRESVLAFVQQMGGFAAARDAITQLEQSLQGLLKT